MKKIENFVILAPKLNSAGSIKYCLWVDETGNLYVQMIENEGSGTFSNHLFSVSKYQSKRRNAKALGSLEAFNIENNTVENVNDNNNGAFLKAVLRHLLPSGDQ